jgi:uncharacterized protein
MLLKIHKSYRDIIAVCDNDILGKIFEEGEKQIEIKENFFGGEEIGEVKLIELLKDWIKEDATFNIVGKNSVQAALKAGIISQEGIKTIQDIPFALVLL